MTNYKNDEKITKEIRDKAEKAFSTMERLNAESTWEQISKYMSPILESEFFENTMRGERKGRRQFSGVAAQAKRDLANFLHATITNPTMEWSKLKFRSDELNNSQECMTWLQNSVRDLHIALNESNFNSEIGEGYDTICSMGTMALYQEEIYDEQGNFEKFNFQSWHLAELAYAENHLGIVDTIYRKFSMTLKQLHEKFGDAIGEDLLERVKTSPLETRIIYHAIYPRKGKKIKAPGEISAPKERPFASCYVDAGSCKLLMEGGYYEFPVYVPRWSTSPSEIYGYGPGHAALSDTMCLNKIWADGLRSLSKSVLPPIFSTKQNILNADLRPGKLNIVRDVNQIKEFVTQSRFDMLQFAIEYLTNSIKSYFYIDKLLLPPRTETGEMTAYEVAQRLEQLQQILGPMVSRFNVELLTPLMMRSLRILQRAGVVKPYPEDVVRFALMNGAQHADVEILFVNSLARSQQLSELRNVQTFMQEVMQLAQANPQVLEKINFDEVVEYAARIRGIPEQLIKSDQEVEEARQAQQQAMEQQQMLQSGEQISNMIGKAGPAIQGLMESGQGQEEGAQ